MVAVVYHRRVACSWWRSALSERASCSQWFQDNEWTCRTTRPFCSMLVSTMLAGLKKGFLLVLSKYSKNTGELLHLRTTEDEGKKNVCWFLCTQWRRASHLFPGYEPFDLPHLGLRLHTSEGWTAVEILAPDTCPLHSLKSTVHWKHIYIVEELVAPPTL